MTETEFDLVATGILPVVPKGQAGSTVPPVHVRHRDPLCMTTKLFRITLDKRGGARAAKNSAGGSLGAS